MRDETVDQYQFGGRNNRELSPSRVDLFHRKRESPNQFNHFSKESHPERKVTLLILVLSLLAIGFFWVQTGFQDWWQNFFKPYTFEIISGQSSPIYHNKDEVIKKIADLTENLAGEYAVYIYSFKKGEAYGVNQSDVFPAASINKVPLMLAFYREIEKGNFSETDEYRLQKSDIQDYGTGNMRYEDPGKVYTYQELLELTGKQSDNTAAYVIGNILGLANVQKFVQGLGLEKTSLEENKTTAEDLGKLFVMTHEGKIFKTEKYKNQFFSNLKETDFEDRIPAGLPGQTPIAHKIGSGERAYHDCGLVFARQPFVLCILSKEAAEDEALDVTPKIAKVVWDFEEK